MTVRVPGGRWCWIGTGVLAAGGLAIVAALWADLRDFDRTRGGYDPPYTGFTGTPIDWSTLETTGEGMLHRGRLLHVRIDCTTGMIRFRMVGISIPFRTFSPRAIAVHRPREACAARGFAPEF